MPPGTGLLVRSFPELVGVSVVTVGDSSFTLSRRVFLRAAGDGGRGLGQKRPQPVGEPFLGKLMRGRKGLLASSGNTY